ncbi:MAG: adenylate/guanylate cyclase domain-containing protein [Alphaproteobacteria bacterium]|nr:adenylate/guanylate cyclase domain-containing protein [Alphaproteobacteria bacterium]
MSASNRLWLQRAVSAIVAAGLAAAALTLLPFGFLGGLSLDSQFWLRKTIMGPQHAPDFSPTVVVAIDEETYRRAPFAQTPKVLWTPEIAGVIESVAAGGARVFGLDVIFPTSVASHLPAFETPFLLSLRKQAQAGRMVLSRVQHSQASVEPSAAQKIAVGQNRNIRAANVVTDPDGVIRAVPLAFKTRTPTGEPGWQPSLAAELALRGNPDLLRMAEGGKLLRDGQAVPVRADGAMWLNFDGDQSTIPTYSLADLHACRVAGDTKFFEQNFAGRTVLVATVVDVEDRKLTSLRYAAAPDSAGFARRCQNPILQEVYEGASARSSLPGVYLHATVINGLVRGEFLTAPPGWTDVALIFLLGLAVALVATYRSLKVAALAAVVAVFGWGALSTVSFASNTILPLFSPILAALLALGLATAFRVFFTEREGRMIRRMFGLYLAPSVIERMVGNGEMPSLGGETRELTIYFSDLSGFTAMSEGKTPDELVALMNTYLTAMSDVIEEHGGFIDKYIGDAIVAVFGAPQNDTRHAENAVAAALACQERLLALNAEFQRSGQPALQQRVGLNTGQILVGNIGSRRRFNYTVMGDAVNLAARLESANKTYGTEILISGDVLDRCADRSGFREIDRVRVIGRDEPVDLHVPVAEDAPASLMERYALALDAYRQGKFTTAIAGWRELTDVDPVSATMRARAESLLTDAPTDWDGVYDLESK